MGKILKQQILYRKFQQIPIKPAVLRYFLTNQSTLLTVRMGHLDYMMAHT